MPAPTPFDFAPYRLSGVVYAALLNHRPALAALGDSVNRPPYKAAPQAPVLAVRPRNTLAFDGAAVAVPEAVEVGASLGIVIARAACRVAPADAPGFVAGYVVVADLSLPHDSHYRPATRSKARDDFCVIGPHVTPAAGVPWPDALALRIRIDGESAQQTDTADRVRSVAQLIADVTEFMTLLPGDLLLLGASHGAPLARAGQRVAVEIDGLAALAFGLVTEAAPT